MIVKKKGICGGDAIITGTRIRVADIVNMKERLGYTTGDIIRAYPGLHKKQIQAAMRYHREHLTEVQQVIKADDTVGG